MPFTLMPGLVVASDRTAEDDDEGHDDGDLHSIAEESLAVQDGRW